MLALEKRLFASPKLKMVVANSQMVKDDIIRHYGLPEKKICVIYNGISGALALEGAEFDKARRHVRNALKTGDDETLILFVGSGFERKGLLYLIRAIAILCSGGKAVKLLVVGKGNIRRYINEARRLGIAERVIFNGPTTDVRQFYAGADIFCLPSIYEPFSNACLEAFAHGLAVITTSANGASEIINAGVDGAVVDDPSDHKALAGAIGQFLEPAKREKAAKSAKNTALKYPIEDTVSGFLKLIGEIRKKKDGKIP
jgi:UDP-glucose:(heptosyl)LPS alpha-1,3-glucosyltransferase